ncbi:hypothetical protein [uncultured Umboniibacter sp.]|uniref:hypothetical protein n=1 Tax=uncultured Umboniibacter sp. TaxID=1798917 RepID=UPI0026206244|nr:hypothetical protein [uncultured Umboniibacter sp.]
MKKLILPLVVATLTGCAVNDYAQMSQGSGINELELSTNCEPISCSYDKIKGRVEATASDMNVFLSINGSETRTIQYRWVSGSNTIYIDVFSTNLYSSWSFVESAEIYIGSELVTKVSGRVDRQVGYYNDVAREHEKVERISDVISIEDAEKIANANYESVTIRFYGKNGYQDVELPREHKLINIVKLAKSA